MGTRPVTANPSQILVEQLSACGVEYVFYNSGSREALFFDALHAHPRIHGVLALHEGSVAAMAGGYTQVKLEAGVMVVHLGAGLAQSLGQLINAWSGSLPVVVITFAGDTGSFADKIELDLHHSFGPTSISAPFTKASWTVIEPEGLPQAVSRAIRVARTPPVGPVHLAVYDRLLGPELVSTNIVDGAVENVRAGYPADSDVEEIARALRDADRPLIYVGDGVWKSGAEARVMALAEYFGVPVAGDTRSVPIRHRLHCGPFDGAIAAIEPDMVLCAGVRHRGMGRPEDFGGLATTRRIISVGPGVDNIKNIPGVGLAVLADEARTFERLQELTLDEGEGAAFDERRSRALGQVRALRARRRSAAKGVAPQSGTVRPYIVADAIDQALEEVGGGLVTSEQFAVPLDAVGESVEPGRNVYLRPAGGSEGYGVGGAIGVKLAAPDRPVIGLVGDGSLYYADSGLWTARCITAFPSFTSSPTTAPTASSPITSGGPRAT